MTNLQLRGGTAVAWAVANPVLLAREMGVESDTGRFKIGDGVTAWNSLAYSSGAPGPAIAPFSGEQGEDGSAGIPGMGANGPTRPGVFTSFSTALQSPAAAVLTYITGSAIALPTGRMQIGTMFRWKFNLTKTAAGAAASTIDVRVGTLGTTGDAARLTFTKPAGSAAIDEGRIDIIVTFRGPISASGIFVGEMTMIHNLAATGHMVIPVMAQNVISGVVDVTVQNLIVGLTITTGAGDVITIQMVQAVAMNLPGLP